MCSFCAKLLLVVLVVISSLHIMLCSYCTRGIVIEHGSVRYFSRGRIAKFRCHPGFSLIGDKFTTCESGIWEQTITRCVKPTCRPILGIANATIYGSHKGAVYSVFCHSKYQIRGPDKLFCNGKDWDPAAPTCILKGVQPLRQCDFDSGLCGFSQDLNHDFDWKRENSKTPLHHVETGPKYDHSRGIKGTADDSGFYMYIESESQQVNDTARLFSPIYDRLIYPFCISFYYHMFGSGVGSLNVYVKPIDMKLNALKPVFQQHGNHGDVWYEGRVLLSSISNEFQVIFEGVRGDSIISNIAIDDFKIIDNCSSSATESPPVIDRHSTNVTLDFTCENHCGSSSSSKCNCTEDCVTDGSCCVDFFHYCLGTTVSNVTSTISMGTSSIHSEKTTLPATQDSRPTLATWKVATIAKKIELNTVRIQQESMVSDENQYGHNLWQNLKNWAITIGLTIAILVCLGFSSFLITRKLILTKLRNTNSDSASDVRFLKCDETLNFNMLYEIDM